MFNRTTSTTFIGRACPESSKVEGTPRNALCHFDRREKSFLDPSHLLSLRALSPSLGALCVCSWDDSFFVLVVFFMVILVFLFKSAALSPYANRGKTCN